MALLPLDKEHWWEVTVTPIGGGQSPLSQITLHTRARSAQGAAEGAAKLFTFDVKVIGLRAIL